MNALALPEGETRRLDLLDGRHRRVDGGAQPADQLFRFRGARDGRGGDAARHEHGGRAELRRLPRCQLRRVRHHQAAGLRPDRAVQADQHDEAVRAGPCRPVRLPRARARADQASPMGNHREQLRPHDEVRDRDPAADRLHRGAAAPLHLRTTHPAYAAMLETGRAQRSIFLARWLRDRDLQRETEFGLNVVENYNGVSTTTSGSASAASSPPTAARSRSSGCCACTSSRAASAWSTP